MITKSDFDAVFQKMTEEERAKHPLPTSEELLAYTRGTLSEEEAEAFRERLMAYPELVRTLAEPFPEPAQPGDPDYLSEHEFARLWRAPAARGALRLWQSVAAVAAVVAVVAGVQAARLRNELVQPHGGALTVLSGAARGIDDAGTLSANKAQILYFRASDAYQLYRVEIRDAGGKLRWLSKEPLRAQEESITVFIPAHFLAPGKYDIVLYGLAGARQEELEHNPVRVR